MASLKSNQYIVIQGETRIRAEEAFEHVCGRVRRLTSNEDAMDTPTNSTTSSMDQVSFD